MATYFQVSPRGESAFPAFRVRATTHQDAAEVAARRLHGRRATALRATGYPGLGGVFQSYLPARTGGQTSIGGAFHVTEW